MSSRLAAFTAAISLCACFQAMAENNLLFNPGFELGNSGYLLLKVLRPETNKSLVYEGPIVEKSDSATGNAIRIPNRFAEHCEFFANELELEKGADYTFSMWAKSQSGNASVDIHIVSPTCKNGWDGAIVKTVKVGPEWTHFNFNFKPSIKSGNTHYWFKLIVGKPKDEPAGDVWFKDLQVAKGKDVKDWTPNAAVEIAVKPEQTLLVDEGKGCIANLTVPWANNTKAKIISKATVKVNVLGSLELASGNNASIV